MSEHVDGPRWNQGPRRTGIKLRKGRYSKKGKPKRRGKKKVQEETHTPAIVSLTVQEVLDAEASLDWTGNGGEAAGRAEERADVEEEQEIYAWGEDGDHEDGQAQDW